MDTPRISVWKIVSHKPSILCKVYRGADKSLDRPTYRCILFDGENILFDASLVVYTRIYK